ncbi:MAG: hypothetical protein ABIZ04_21685 [Opitutus sp.]
MNAIRYAKKPLVRRIAIKAGKVLTAGIVGHQIGKRVGSRAGAVVGGAAGLLFSAENSVETMNTNQHAKTVSRSVASHRSGHSRGLESQTVGSLDKRLKVPAGVGAALIKLGAITSRGPVMRGNNELLQFDSGELDRLQQASLSDVAEQAIDQSNGNPGELVTSAQNALADHVKQFSDPMSDAQIAAVGKKGAYGYAAGSQFLPRRSSTTYHGTEPYLKQVAEWTRKPASPGGAITKAAAAHAGEDAAKRKAALAMLATATGRYSRAARRSSRATEFSTDWIEADGPHPIRKVAGVVGGVAALVGGAAYLRGRSLAPTANPFQKIRIGSAANLATGKAVANGVSRVAAVLAGRRPH